MGCAIRLNEPFDLAAKANTQLRLNGGAIANRFGKLPVRFGMDRIVVV
jgi:hypothetical protein